MLRPNRGTGSGGTSGASDSGGSGGSGGSSSKASAGGAQSKGGSAGSSAGRASGGSSGSKGGSSSEAGGGGADGGSNSGRSGGSGAAGTSGNGASGGTHSGGAGGQAGADTGGQAGEAGSGTTDEACQPRESYRNLFAEMLGKTADEVRTRLDEGFQHFFHGNDQQRIYYESGADEAYILDVNNGDVRSEGLSYGMMIAVQMDKQVEFDRLWKWAKVHTQQPNGYFAWQTTPQGQILSTTAAPDGEEYYATALIFAHHRWGSDGAHDYAGEAQELLTALRTQGAFNQDPPVVKFVASVSYSDPSYVLPAFYQVWSCFDEVNRSFWDAAIVTGRSVLQNAAHDETGLAPYLSHFDGTPHGNGPNFNSDAWRVVGNIMMDHHWFRADPWQMNFAETYANFFHNTWTQRPNAYEFDLSGNVLRESSGGPPRGLVAMNSLVAFAASQELAVPALQKLWDLQRPTAQYRYYDGMLYLFAYLHASGNYRIY
jgi:endo-1,4-beta-D-glucanase Y